MLLVLNLGQRNLCDQVTSGKKKSFKWKVLRWCWSSETAQCNVFPIILSSKGKQSFCNILKPCWIRNQNAKKVSDWAVWGMLSVKIWHGTQ